MSITINIKKVLLITAIPFLFSATCNKKIGSTPCPKNLYSFTTTSEFSKQNEIYQVGDTIYLNSSFSKQLIDKISNLTIDYSNSISIDGNLTTSIMDTITHLIADAPTGSFTIFTPVGTITPISNKPEKGVTLYYFEDAALYKIRIGIICNKKGLYQLAVTNLGSKGIKGTNCTSASFDMTVTNTDKHFNLFQYALGYYPDALLQKNIYCFRVQ